MQTAFVGKFGQFFLPLKPTTKPIITNQSTNKCYLNTCHLRPGCYPIKALPWGLPAPPAARWCRRSPTEDDPFHGTWSALPPQNWALMAGWSLESWQVVVTTMILPNKCSLCPRHCDKGFTWIISFSPSLSPVREILSYPYRNLHVK